VMCRNVIGGAVESFTLSERDDGSSNRRRIFLTYNDIGKKAGLPATVFCKAAETLENRIVLGVSLTALAEANFYNKVRERVEFEAPRAWFAGFDPKSFAYLIVMDDMGGNVHFPDERTILTRLQAEALITTLAQLHSRFYKSAELGTDALPFKRWPAWWADMMRGAPDFPEYCDRGFAAAESVLPARLVKRRAEIWPATDLSVARHHRLPQTLIHSDVHLKNWYITPDGRMGLADWQLVTIGHWSRDFDFFHDHGAHGGSAPCVDGGTAAALSRQDGGFRLYTGIVRRLNAEHPAAVIHGSCILDDHDVSDAGHAGDAAGAYNLRVSQTVRGGDRRLRCARCVLN
jgi:hypothetical protein